MQIANIHDAKAHLSRLIQRALAGEEVVIARAGEPMVKLVPYEQDLTPRRGGQLRGRIRVGDDFDAFDAELEEAFNGPLFPAQ